MKALVSDIHSNLEALQAVLADIAQHNVSEVYCLGDIIGYGPNPRASASIWFASARSSFWATTIKGPCSIPTASTPPNEPSSGRAPCRSPAESRQSKEERLGVPRRAAAGAQGERAALRTARRAIRSTSMSSPKTSTTSRKMDRIFALVEKYCFQGHTHVPGVFTENPQDDLYQFHSPEDLNYEFKFDARKALVNVGSVGQPATATGAAATCSWTTRPSTTGASSTTSK